MAPRGTAKKVQNSEEVDGDGRMEKAHWDKDLHAVFVKLCVQEKKKGNMPTTHFTIPGWKSITTSFHEKTKRPYTRGQLKNHWDFMRKEWQAWNLLKQKTIGLGWNPGNNSATPDATWWEEMGKVNKLVLKFKYKGLEHEDEYFELFSRATATGDNASAPSQGPSEEPCIPQPSDQIGGYDVSSEESQREEEDENCEVTGAPVNESPNDEIRFEESLVRNRIGPIIDSGKKRLIDDGQSSGSSRKRRKLTSADKISNALYRMAKCMERRANATLSLASGISVKETLNVLEQLPGVVVGSPLYFLACRLFANPYHRDLFVSFSDNDRRLSWLKHMELREPHAHLQQLAQLPGGFSLLLGQSPSGFSHQIAQGSSGFSQFPQPQCGFSQQLAQPPSVVPQPPPVATTNQFPSPSNVFPPHSTSDA